MHCDCPDCVLSRAIMTCCGTPQEIKVEAIDDVIAAIDDVIAYGRDEKVYGKLRARFIEEKELRTH